MFTHFYAEIQRLNTADHRVNTIEKKMMKTMEELGELSEAILIDRDHKIGKTNQNKIETRDHVLEEICDLFIMAASVADHERFTEEEIGKKLLQKLLKWENGLKKAQENLKTKYV